MGSQWKALRIHSLAFHGHRRIGVRRSLQPTLKLARWPRWTATIRVMIPEFRQRLADFSQIRPSISLGGGGIGG